MIKECNSFWLLLLLYFQKMIRLIIFAIEINYYGNNSQTTIRTELHGYDG